MIAIIVIGLISLAACLTSIFVAIEQRFKGNDDTSATAYLWAMWTFTIFSMCAIAYATLTI
jgi:hypothetical protein